MCLPKLHFLVSQMSRNVPKIDIFPPKNFSKMRLIVVVVVVKMFKSLHLKFKRKKPQKNASCVFRYALLNKPNFKKKIHLYLIFQGIWTFKGDFGFLEVHRPSGGFSTDQVD